MTRLTVDSNILVYMLDAQEPARRESATAIVAHLSQRDAVLTLQALGECLHTCSRKRIASQAAILEHLVDLRRLFREPASATPASFDRAAAAWQSGRFSFWDAMLLAAAGAAGCEAVISEDMHDGAMLDGVRVIGAFDSQGGVSAAAREALGIIA